MTADLSMGTLWRRARQALAEKAGLRAPEVSPSQLGALMPGDDPGIYRAALQRVELWSLSSDGHIAREGEIMRPRLPTDRAADAGDRYPDTVLASFSSKCVDAVLGELKENKSPYVAVTPVPGALVAAVLQLRPDAFSADKYNFLVSDLECLLKHDVAIAVDASFVVVNSISSVGRDFVRETFCRHQQRFGVPISVIGSEGLQKSFGDLQIPAHFFKPESAKREMVIEKAVLALFQSK